MKRLLLLVSLLAISTFALASTVDLNSATQAQIAALPQMGSVKAKAIVDYRTAKGCFNNVSDLLQVNGITQADVDAIRSMVVIGRCREKGTKAQT
jgi:competence protein ComEA